MSIAPGQITFADAVRCVVAALRVRPAPACLLAVYAGWLGCGLNELVLAMLTMLPPLPVASITPSWARMHRNSGGDVDAHHPLEVVVRGLVERHVFELDFGTVHGGVEPTETVDGGAHHAAHRVGIGDVAGDVGGVVAERAARRGARSGSAARSRARRRALRPRRGCG